MVRLYKCWWNQTDVHVLYLFEVLQGKHQITCKRWCGQTIQMMEEATGALSVVW